MARYGIVLGNLLYPYSLKAIRIIEQSFVLLFCLFVLFFNGPGVFRWVCSKTAYKVCSNYLEREENKDYEEFGSWILRYDK